MQEIASAQVLRNTRLTYLIDQANRLNFCKRNIMLSKIFFWDLVLDDLISGLLRKVPNKRSHNANETCIDFLRENSLSHPDFLEFFITLHEPLTLAFLKIIKREISNGLPISEKILLLVTELTELLNIAFIELEGMDINCDLFKSDPVCIKNLNHCDLLSEKWEKKCLKECSDVSNVYTLIMCKEYFIETNLFDNIIKKVSDILFKNDIIFVIDYYNMKKYMDNYNWEKTGGWERYKKSAHKMKGLYFYNTENFVDFGSKYEEIKSFIIPDKAGYDLVKKNWREKRELTYFA